MLGLFLAATTMVLASSTDLQEVEKRTVDWDLLKDLFQFHLYVNPHPVCALEDESCTLDNNCCRGLECKVNVDRNGVRYTCQPKIMENKTNDVANDDEDVNEDDVRWSLRSEARGSDESTNSVIREIFQSRLEQARKDEERLLNDRYYLIKEMKKPLTMEELRELQQLKEVEDYKREKELRELREWARKRDEEDAKKAEMDEMLKKTAKDRVNRVLAEEERQKMQIFKKVQEAMKQDTKKS